jgi:hypothetical protein
MNPAPAMMSVPQSRIRKLAIACAAILIGSVEVHLTLAAYSGHMSEPFSNVESYFADTWQFVFDPDAFVKSLLGWAVLTCIPALIFRVFRLAEPWKPLCQVTLWMLFPIAAWSFSAFFAAMRNENFGLGNPPPAWMNWEGFANFGNLYVLGAMVMGSLIAWGYLMNRQNAPPQSQRQYQVSS